MTARSRGRRLVGYAFLAAFFVFLYGLTVLSYLLAYQDLAGAYCDMHRMHASETRSVLHVNGLRGGHTVEHLNPPGARPAELTLPSTAHPSPGAVIRSVYPPVTMRRLHRGDGFEMLAFGGLFTLITYWYTVKFFRVRRAAHASGIAVDE